MQQQQQKKIWQNAIDVQMEFLKIQVDSGWTCQPKVLIWSGRVGPLGLQTGAGRVGPQGQNSGQGRVGLALRVKIWVKFGSD